MTLHFSAGLDLQGDACLYLQVLDENKDDVLGDLHARYASYNELAALADELTLKADKVETPEQFTRLLETCRLERKS